MEINYCVCYGCYHATSSSLQRVRHYHTITTSILRHCTINSDVVIPNMYREHINKIKLHTAECSWN